jgi:drug/metabolite transporter (DMT)-like permease
MPWKYPPLVQAIAMMVLSMFFFSWMNIFVRYTYQFMGSEQMVFIRNVMLLALMGLWILREHPKGFFKTTRLKALFWYAATGVLAIEMWFYALTKMSLNEATALSFTAPVFVTLFAILFLKERATWERGAAIGIGLIGTLIILRPDTQALNFVAIIVLVSAALMAISSIFAKSATSTEHPDRVVFYQGLLMTPMSLPFVFGNWQPIGWEALFWVLMVTVSSMIAHLLVVRAFQLCDMVVLMPFDFTRLLFTALLAWWWFGETLDMMTLLGGMLIVMAAVWGAAAGNDEVKKRIKRLMTLSRE